MKYRVILVEQDESMLMQLSGELRASSDFDLVASYQDAKSALGRGSMFRPNLFLLDIDDPDTLNQISRFKLVFPQASFMGTMNTWDADIADQALLAGIQGCLMKPFKAEDILTTFSIYDNRGDAKPARIVSFFSPKGRAGRTTLSAILGIELARRSGESVAIIDADLQFGDMPMFFDVTPEHTVVEAAHDINLLTPESLLPYFHNIQDKIWLLGSPNRPEYAELVEAESLVKVIRMAGQLFRYVLVDLPSGFNPLSVAVCEQADTNFLVTMINSGEEVWHMKRALRLFDEWGQDGKRVYTVFMRVSPCNKQEKRKLEHHFGQPISYILPNEYQLANITASGRLLKDLQDDSPFTESVAKVADDIIQGKW